MVGSSIPQFQGLCFGLNYNSLEISFRSDDQGCSTGQGAGERLTIKFHHGSHRLIHEDAGALIHQPGFSKQIAWEELQVEASPVAPLIWQGLIKVDRNADASVIFGFNFYLVKEVQVRINHRIESLPVFGGIRIPEFLDDALIFLVNCPFSPFRYRRPLSG